MLAALAFSVSAYYQYKDDQYKAMTKAILQKFCIIKNCHNCARSFNNNFGKRATRAVCTAMYRKKKQGNPLFNQIIKQVNLPFF